MPDVYVAQWPEESILAYFETMVRAGADRIALLQQLARVAVERPPEWNTQAVRQDSGRPQVRIWSCFACWTRDRRLYWHHIIWVKHGGSAAAANMVPLCLRCHSLIHPWLPADRPGENRSGWTSMANVVAAQAPRVQALLAEMEPVAMERAPSLHGEKP